jgi:hypothetical protein
MMKIITTTFREVPAWQVAAATITPNWLVACSQSAKIKQVLASLSYRVAASKLLLLLEEPWLVLSYVFAMRGGCLATVF